jgi:preprotein translocase subunit SecA
LHQALEAKEHVSRPAENQTLASITFQNYFRLYDKLAGMTGTAMTEADEFCDIYKLDVVEMPTNVPVHRKDEDDEVYRTARREAERHRRSRRRRAAGRHEIEKSSRCWSARSASRSPSSWRSLPAGRRHPPPGAERALPRAGSLHHRPGRPARRRHHRHQHGRPRHRHPARRQRRACGMRRTELAEVTDPESAAHIEARSAERGGKAKKQVLAAGGLYVLGTERHESRRIDNQLRGRSGRQGDPGGRSSSSRSKTT